MNVNPLGRILHPDFNDTVIHFTGRRGVQRNHPQVASETDEQRLLRILAEQQFLAFAQPGTAFRSVCFTEATSDGCAWMIGTGRYTSCGLAFSKQYLFGLGGGPVLQIRGDEWEHVARLPPQLQARAVRLWPGASDTASAAPLPWYLSGRSEWSFEREWRVPSCSGESVPFNRNAVQFLVVPSRNALENWVRRLNRHSPDLATWLAGIRYVVIGKNGLLDSNGVAVRRSGSTIGT